MIVCILWNTANFYFIKKMDAFESGLKKNNNNWIGNKSLSALYFKAILKHNVKVRLVVIMTFTPLYSSVSNVNVYDKLKNAWQSQLPHDCVQSWVKKSNTSLNIHARQILMLICDIMLILKLTMCWAVEVCRWGCSPGEPSHQTCQSCCWHLPAMASFR